jgi:hypothetical protein
MVKLVLLTGMDGTGDLFEPLIKALPGIEIQVIRYPLDRSLSYPELLSLVTSSLSGSEPFALLAESFSTPIAIQLAAKRPPNLKRGCHLRGVCRGSGSWMDALFGEFRIAYPVSSSDERVCNQEIFARPIYTRIDGQRSTIRDQVRSSHGFVEPIKGSSRLRRSGRGGSHRGTHAVSTRFT